MSLSAARLLTRHAIGALALAALSAPTVLAGSFKQATVRRMVQGREVFIDRQPARLNQTAGRGQQISTGNSRAELLFDQRALGFLGKQSLIQLGQSCFRLQGGSVLVNGDQRSCLGSRVLGVRGTTYVLTRLPEERFKLAVLHGEARVTEPANESADSPADNGDILSRYPRLNPVADLGSSAFASNAGGERLGEALGLVLADGGMFLPLHQANGSQVLYSYTRGSANFDGFWGISSEIGYRWFDPNNQSLNGVLAGYDGWQSDRCFQSQLAVGGEWERNRWQFTALGGIPVDTCQSSIGYAIAGVGIPVARLSGRTMHVGVSPYVLHGLGDNFGGGRLSLSVPLGSDVDLMGYGQYDGLLNTTLGGQLRVRFAIGQGGSINDPNLPPIRPGSPLPWQGRQPRMEQQIAVQPREISLESISSDAPSGLLAATDAEVSVMAGEEAILTSDGQLISKRKLEQKDFEELIRFHLAGMPLLPESHAIGTLYERLFQRPLPAVLAITGLNWYVGARSPMPRLRGANNLEVPPDKLPRSEAPPANSVGANEQVPPPRPNVVPPNQLNLVDGLQPNPVLTQ